MYSNDTGKDYKTISLGTGAQAASAAVDMGEIGGVTALTGTIIAPATLTANCKIEVSADGATYGTLQSGGSDIEIAAGKAIPLTEISARHLRIRATGTEGSARTFHLIGRGRGTGPAYG
jgi:hypothetical protein